MSDANVSRDDSSQRPQDGGGNRARDEQEAQVQAIHQAAFAEDASADSIAAELDEANNRVLRAQAELENYRKRARRELEEERRYANLPLLQDLLGVLDNLDRAVLHAEQSEQAAGLLEGVKMVSSQLRMTLEKYHCVPIAAEGSAFDPHLHEAIGKEPCSDQPPGIVTRVTQPGYCLHDRVVRPAQVMISAAADPS